MFFFVAYAVIVWYGVFLHRRRWRGFAIALGSVAGLVLVAIAHWRLSVWTHGRIYLPVLQALLYPYTALVGFMGLYIGVLPRRAPDSACPACHYDLSGLAPDAIGRCPECGEDRAAAA